MDFYGFYTGKEFEAYRFLGAHACERGTVFRTFAPNAQRISLIGEFNGWQETPMQKVYDGNFWECYVENAGKGMMYKYKIYGADGSCIDHCDPYGFYSELRPNNASIIYDTTDYHFTDSEWMKKRSVQKDAPLNIYEIHFGSWRKKDDKDAEGWYTYREMADLLIPYLNENGYNYVELMPLSEHPCDESWGYQNTGFFAPTSRYGTPDDLRYFVNACHKHKIGVLMDFVPVHFAVDAYALWNYDGSALYEYPNQDVGYSEWGSCNFMHSRGEVRSFLQSAAAYWLSEYHFDGLRMDAVSNLIYWQGNEARGVNNLAVSFIQNMNQGLKDRFPTTILMAEDSSSYPGVTRSVHDGGLGFDYKWDMGWMNDTLNYFRTAPEYRSENYHKLTFSMMYYYNEAYVLPLSHDEVVHGKATIIQKMSGDYEEKFPQARVMYMYMYAHPGKKLIFMGTEFCQFIEWNYEQELDWLLLAYPFHQKAKHFFQSLNHFYLNTPSLWEVDFSWEGFSWIAHDDNEQSVIAFRRIDKSGHEIIAVCNFVPVQREHYCIGVPFAGTYEEVFTTDAEEFGGNGITNGNAIKTIDEPMHGFEQCIPLTLPPLSVIYLKCKRRKQTKAAAHTDKTPTKVTKTVRKTADKKTKTTDKKTKKKAD